MTEEPDFPMDRTIVKGLLDTRVQYEALLAALDALVQDMATISGVHGVPHADASELAMKATAYWQGRLDGLLRQHRAV